MPAPLPYAIAAVHSYILKLRHCTKAQSRLRSCLCPEPDTVKRQLWTAAMHKAGMVMRSVGIQPCRFEGLNTIGNLKQVLLAVSIHIHFLRLGTNYPHYWYADASSSKGSTRLQCATYSFQRPCRIFHVPPPLSEGYSSLASKAFVC